MTPPKTLPLAGGAAVCVLALLALGIKTINKSRDTFLDDLARDTSKSFDGMRMEANAKADQETNNELRQHETALKTLRESRKKGTRHSLEASTVPS